MNLKQTVEEWLQKGYLAAQGGTKGSKYMLTTRFYDALKGEALGEAMEKRDQLEARRSQPPPPAAEVTHAIVPAAMASAGGLTITRDGRVNGMLYSELFIHFIAQAAVPQKVPDSRGNLYVVNKYNEKAAAVLYKLVTREGIDYGLLVKSTMLYYKGANRFKKTVGNYITEGDWRGDYLALRQSASQGAEALDKHIREEISNEPGYNGYQLG